MLCLFKVSYETHLTQRVTFNIMNKADICDKKKA